LSKGELLFGGRVESYPICRTPFARGYSLGDYLTKVALAPWLLMQISI